MKAKSFFSAGVGLAMALALLAGCGEEKVVEFGSLQQRGGIYVVPETQKPYSGKFVETEENIVIKAGSLKNGKLNGELTTYREDGSIDKVETFADDVLNGKWERYYENGQVERAGRCKDGKRDGKWEFYSENGKLSETGHYKISEGGEWVEFKDCVSGKRDGRFEEYSENGKLRLVKHYKDGKPDGKREIYDENGKLIQLGSFSDSRDGKTYKTVKIGTQIWMAENLNYEAEGSKCYENNSGNCQKYGRLYNWQTAMKSCPSGWHLPNDDEWQKLVDIAGGNEAAGTTLKATNGWESWMSYGNGSDGLGFSALPGGEGNSDGGFITVGHHGYWWSATEYNANNAYPRNMHYYDDNVEKYDTAKSSLFSVRCVQD